MFKMACKLSSSVVNKTENISNPVESGKRGSEFEAMEEEEGEVGKPVRKKKLIRVLRAKQRGGGARLNTSRLRGHCINSSLNSTLLKQTLRTNNRALAKALEMKRQELYNAQQTIVQQQEAQQHTLQQLSNLQRIAGLKDSAIETEVQLRIQNRMDDTRKVLSKVCMQLLSTVDLIHGALDISSCRSSSVSRPSTPLGDIMTSTHKTVFYNGPRTPTEPPSCPPAEPDIDIVAASAALDRSLGDVELAASAVTLHPDLSVILEQSQLMDSVPILFTEDDQLEGQQFARPVRSHSRQRKDGSRRAGQVYPPACTTLTPPPPQPCSDKIMTNESQSQQNSPVIAVGKLQRETTNMTSSTSNFDGMSMEEAFGRRDAGLYQAEDRPLPTLAKRQQFDVSSSGGLIQGHVTEVSSGCIKKRSKLKRASRVMVSSLSHQVACDVDAVTATSAQVVTDDGGSCDRRGTFVVTPSSATTKETQDVVERGGDNEPREGEEKEAGILEEEFDNFLVAGVEDDILSASPITEASSKCVRNVAPEQTIYSDEDMEMTGVFSIPVELTDGKMSVPAFINRESAHEPSFLANVTTDEQDTQVVELLKQDVSKETKTRKAATKKPSKKTDNPPKHKLTLKKGKGNTSRRSSSKKLARKVDPAMLDDESKATSDRETKKFSTYITKPGQMSFTTGKLDQMAPPKGTSMLPRVTARSKPRAKTNKSTDTPATKESQSTTDEPKSVFDMSMNESVIMVRTKYSDFREHCTATSSKDSSSDDASSDVNVGDGSHGIMLTLGNGKRTKPRRARSKQVSYASVTVNTVTPVSDVTKLSSVTGETPQTTECSDTDGTSTSGDDNVFVSSVSHGDGVSVTAAGRVKRPRRCRSSVVYNFDTPDTSISIVDDTAHGTEGGSDKETLSRKSGHTGVRCPNPDEDTGAATVEGANITTDDGVSDKGNFAGPDKKSGQREVAREQPNEKESCVEEKERDGRTATEQDRETVNKPTARRESKVKQKEDVSKVKPNQVKSKVKEYESKMKENKFKVKQKEKKLKMKQKELNLKEKCSQSNVEQKEFESNRKEGEAVLKQKDVESKEDECKEDESEGKQKDECKEDEMHVKEKDTASKMMQKEPEFKVKQKDRMHKVKEIASKVKQDDAESEMQQKESKKTEPRVRRTLTGQRPKVKETPTSKSNGGLSREKRRSGKSIIIVGDTSYRQSDKENDAGGGSGVRMSVGQSSGKSDTNNTSEFCKKQKVKKQSIQTGKLCVVHRKRSADEGGQAVSGQAVPPQDPVISKHQPSGAREPVVSRVSVNLPDVSPCKRRRRAASCVNYKEPSLGQKLRQGDPHTVSVYVGKDGEMVVPSHSTTIKKKSELRLSRQPLDTITNGGST